MLAEKKIKQKDLAQKVGRSTTAIARICRNESQPTMAHLYELADALQVDARDLLVPNKYANERRNERQVSPNSGSALQEN